jgi:hypothetical protein
MMEVTIRDEKSEQQLLSDVLRRISDAETFTAGWHTNIDKWRKLYNFDHYKGKPKPGEDRYIDPTHTNAVDLAVGILQSNEMIWRAVGWSPSPAEQEGSSIIEKAIAGFIDINAERKMVDMKSEINRHFVRDGGACLYSIWDKGIHDNFFEMRPMMNKDGIEEMRKVYTELPLRIEITDPKKIVLLPGGHKRFLAVARKERISVYDVEALYNVAIPKYKGLSMTTKMEHMGSFYDYWELSSEVSGEVNPADTTVEKVKSLKSKFVVRNAVIFEDTFLSPLKVMEGYHDIPYTVAFYNPSLNDDSTMWHSLISPQMQSVRELEDAINMRKRLLKMYSNMPLIAQTEGGRPIQIDPALGTAIPIKQGENIGFPSWQGTPPDFERQIDLLRSRIQQSGFSDVMYGSATGVSGYALSQLGDQNRIRLIPAISQLENLWTWAARKWLDLVKEFAADSYMELYGTVKGADFAEIIKGEDLAGFNVRCIIRPEFPNERVRNFAMASQAKGTLSGRRLMEDFYGVQQPDDERQQKLMEMAEEHPVLQQYAIIAKLKEMADGGDEAAGMAMQMIQQQMNPQGQQGRPSEPTNPEQPLGLQSSDGQPAPTPSPENTMSGMIEGQASASPTMDGEISNANF